MMIKAPSHGIIAAMRELFVVLCQMAREKQTKVIITGFDQCDLIGSLFALNVSININRL